MGNSALSNLNEKDKKLFNSLKSKIDKATNYKALRTKESPSPTLSPASAGSIDFLSVNKVSSELKAKIKHKQAKSTE